RDRRSVRRADGCPDRRAVGGPRWQRPIRVLQMDELAFGAAIGTEHVRRSEQAYKCGERERTSHSATYGIVCGPCGNTANLAPVPAAASRAATQPATSPIGSSQAARTCASDSPADLRN